MHGNKALIIFYFYKTASNHATSSLDRLKAQHVRECWEKESYSNVTFTCKAEPGSPKKCLSANKAVLATASRRLHCMLVDTGDNHVDIIIPECDFDSIKMLLRYIYTGEVLIVGKFAKDDLESLISDWVKKTIFGLCVSFQNE